MHSDPIHACQRLAPSGTGRAPDDEIFWATVRAQYDLSPDFINLEHGYFSLQARPVFEAFLAHQRRVNAESSHFLRQSLGTAYADVMLELAALCGVGVEELVLTRNLVEAMNILIQGYPFQPGDQVLLATHDYDSVSDTLTMTSRRKGFTVQRIAIPLDPESDEQIVALYERAICPGTRVLLVTHMVHRSGQIMPVAKIAAMARRHGVDVMVDAAHSFAQLDWKMPDLGADFIAVNLHKWLGAPLGVGMLYIRRERVAGIAPLYGDLTQDNADINKLAHYGTIPPAPVLNIAEAIAFHRWIGVANKEARLRYLTQYWLRQVRAMAQVEVLTPTAPQRSCAIAAFNIIGLPAQQVVARLLAQHRIFTVTREVQGKAAVRVTPHWFTSLTELDLLVAAIRAMLPR